ncbi:MAG TPA: class I SAM-dependent methyltransferase [Xanthobacteraceae bacterium]|jgi:SAM-dependent methyltransferase|nr:class I SAM-dependent methyltransferase [Xanthobacteraceae bacterium]
MTEFEHWESRFSAPDYIFGTAPNEFLRTQARLLPAQGKVLAVADGEGRNGVWLAEQGLDVLSVDFSPKALAKAEALAKVRGVVLQMQRVDIITWAWPNAAFDVVAAIFIQWATPDQRERIFAGIRQALKPGGLLLLQGYRPEQLVYKTGGPSQVENLYTRAMLTEAFAGFADLKIAEHDSVLEEGTRHSGMAALIDLVGRK